MSDGNKTATEAWGSKLGVILAVAGSAVGLGNFLRFPGKAADYGGGAFMIPYFCALLLLGLPICWVEWTQGRLGGKYGFNSAPGIFSVLWRNPIAPYLGSIGLMIPIIIYMYYVYIESWCLLYAAYYAFGAFDDFGKNPYLYSEFFERITGVLGDGAVFADGIQPIFWFFLVTFVANFFVIFRGLSGGIERFCKVAMPALILMAIIVVTRVLTLPEQPAPEVWQKSLAASLPADRWNTLSDSLREPSTDVATARTLIRNEFDQFFHAAVAGDSSFNRSVPVAPPSGFLSRDEGLAVALAELRAGKEGADFRSWIERKRQELDVETKRTLQKIERSQIRLAGRLAGASEAQKGVMEAEMAALDEWRSTILKPAEANDPMPSLAEELAPLGVDGEQAQAVQLRAAAVEIAEIPRTVNNGLGYMWNPDFEELFNAEVWLEAAGQIFFSLSVGFGVILNYASYLRKKDDVVLSGLTATATNEFCEVTLGGLVAIPATFIFLGTATTLDVISRQSTFGLGFNTLPTVFASMPAGRWFGAGWFLLLFLAGITSSLSMLQPAIAFLEEGFGLKRRASVTWLGMLTFCGALVVIYFSGNLLVLDTMDYWVGTFMIYLLATIQVVLFGWVIGIERGMEEAHQGSQMKIPRVFRFIIKYVTPAYLLVIFAAWAMQNAPDRISQISDSKAVFATVLGLGGFFVFLLLLIHLAVLDWRKQGRGLKEVET